MFQVVMCSFCPAGSDVDCSLCQSETGEPCTPCSQEQDGVLQITFSIDLTSVSHLTSHLRKSLRVLGLP